MPKSVKPNSTQLPTPEPAAAPPAAVKRKRHELAQIRRWYANCEPGKKVVKGDGLYVELDDPEHRLRGKFRLDSLKQPIRFKPLGSCQLFSGFAGTGKSTTLRKLKSELEDEDFVVLMADAREYLDLDSPLEIADLLVVLAGAFGDETAKIVGGKGVPDTFWEEIRDILETRLKLEGTSLKLGFLDLKLGVRQGNNFWRNARVKLAETPGELKAKAHDFITGCIARIRHHYNDPNRQVVFIFDSLEQMRAGVVDFTLLMSSAVRVFKSSAAELRLPDCHVVYSVPPYLNLLALEVGGIYDRVSQVLPAVRVESLVGRNPVELEPNEDGIAALREVVDKRVPISELFGLDLAPLDRLILESGGHIRTLITWIRELLYVVEGEGTPVNAQDVDQILKTFGRAFRQAIQKEHIPLLARIFEEGSIEGLPKEDRPQVAELMDRYLVLAYENGDGFYSIHPLVREFILRRSALEKEQADSSNAQP